MSVDIYDEIHEIRNHVNVIDKNVVKLTTLVKSLVEETKEQKNKISTLQRFKNKMIGAFTLSNIGLICLIPLLVILI